MSNGNTLQDEVMETLPEDVGRGTQPMMQEEAGRVKKRLRGLKGLLTKDVSSCIEKMLYFKTKYKDDSIVTNIQIDYANEILTTYSRAQIRYTNLKKNVENLKKLFCDIWEDGDDELNIALEGLTQELISYKKKVLNISRENDEIIERCNVLASKPKVVGNRTRNTVLPNSYVHDKIDVQSNDNAHVGYKVHDKIKNCKKIENSIETNDNTHAIIS